MQTKEQIIRDIERVNRISRAHEIIKTITINWETDVNKMDFSKLRSGGVWHGELKGIRYIKPPFVKSDMFEMDDSMINLIFFIKEDKNKIIPPFLLETYEIRNGKRELNEHSYYMDGNHRAQLSEKLKLQVIPIIVFERNEYLFEIGKYYLDLKENVLNVQSKTGKNVIELDLTDKKNPLIYADRKYIRIII